MAKYQTAFKWLGVTGFIFVFHLIYNYFGHGVQSPKMNWVWLVPAAVLIWQVLVVTIKPAIAQSPKYKTFWAWGNLATWPVIIALNCCWYLRNCRNGLDLYCWVLRYFSIDINWWRISNN
ncbi:hypothetical protein [Weissella confusa]|uniref:Uncharacterized protein n=1 Tax=Weissella confusa TaxID=1583 RepID=A0A4Z0RUY0_WEICO|nr:hypothetical protein [Weissella confusa]TGE71760.1 hypothetical protein C6P11_07865 [Weissella confusa]